MSLPNGGLSDWDRLTIVSKAASATKCANYRNAITKGDATLPPRKNNKAKLLSDESSSSNNGANNNVTTMWQLLPIFSNKGSEKEAKNKTEKEKTKAEAAQKKKIMCWWQKTRTTDSRYASWETWQQFAVPCVCVRGRKVSEVWQQSATPTQHSLQQSNWKTLNYWNRAQVSNFLLQSGLVKKVGDLAKSKHLRYPINKVI